MSLIIRQSGLDDFIDPTGGSWIKALVLGSNGVGKTPFAASFPNPLFAFTEHGVASVAARRIPYAQIESIADMQAFLQIAKRESNKAPADRQYDTVVLDTIDSYQKIVMADRLKAERREQLSQADWGFVANKCDELITDLMNLRMHVLVLAHTTEKEDQDGDSSIQVRRISLKGSFQDSVFHPFDLIGLMEARFVAVDGEKVEKRQIRWKQSAQFPKLRARFSTANGPVLPDFTDVDFTENDFTQIYNAIASAADDIPESAVLESVETEEDEVPVEPEGGPVDKPSLPRAPAKKATKKGPTKRATKKAESASDTESGAPEVSTSVPATEKPVTTPVAKPESDEVGDAEALLKAELGAEVVEERPVEPTKPEPEPEPKSEVHCGDAKPGMSPTVKGCGVALTPENSVKVAIGRLRTHTELCNDCVDAHKRGELEAI